MELLPERSKNLQTKYSPDIFLCKIGFLFANESFREFQIVDIFFSIGILR